MLLVSLEDVVVTAGKTLLDHDPKSLPDCLIDSVLLPWIQRLEAMIINVLNFMERLHEYEKDFFKFFNPTPVYRETNFFGLPQDVETVLSQLHDNLIRDLNKHANNRSSELHQASQTHIPVWLTFEALRFGLCYHVEKYGTNCNSAISDAEKTAKDRCIVLQNPYGTYTTHIMDNARHFVKQELIPKSIVKLMCHFRPFVHKGLNVAWVHTLYFSCKRRCCLKICWIDARVPRNRLYSCNAKRTI